MHNHYAPDASSRSHRLEYQITEPERAIVFMFALKEEYLAYLDSMTYSGDCIINDGDMAEVRMF